jgi:hypothetical protein
VVNGLYNRFLGRLKFIGDIAKVFENLGDESGLFCDFSHGGLLTRLGAFGVSLRNTPVDSPTAI